MQGRLYDKVCARLTCCGGKREEEAGSGKGAILVVKEMPRTMILQRLAVFRAQVVEAHFGLAILDLQERGQGGEKGHRISWHSTAQAEKKRFTVT
jgi:hypothetical protein